VLDRDFVYAQSVRGDFGLAARSVVTGVLGGGGGAEGHAAGAELLRHPGAQHHHGRGRGLAHRGSAPGESPKQLAFVNPDCLNIAWRDAEYRRALLDAERVLPDGIGIHIGCRMQGQALRENVNGTDLFPLLCEAAADAGAPLYLLGARPASPPPPPRTCSKRYPALRLAGTATATSAEQERPR
jgi:N-acetylglucosaminyldiphosphoundecaprenol N-acetyl-beta-D-mannosaminyltransferase